jgi:uncharacterized protein (DUF39 family)
MAREIAELLKEEIAGGEFLITRPIAPLPKEQSTKSLEIRGPQDD